MSGDRPLETPNVASIENRTSPLIKSEREREKGIYIESEGTVNEYVPMDNEAITLMSSSCGKISTIAMERDELAN